MKLPCWTPSRPNRFSGRYFFFSPKLGRTTTASSKLEFERRLLVEFDPKVKEYLEEPDWAQAVIDGKRVRSRFDLLVEFVDGSRRYEEIKYASELKDPASRAHRQIEVQRVFCERMGYSHAVVTDLEIWENPILVVSLRRLSHEFTRNYPEWINEAHGYRPFILESVQEYHRVELKGLLSRRPATVPEHIFRLSVMDLIRTGDIDARLGEQHFCGTSILERRSQ
ncbi:MAG TPA: TnsA endonuclease N-terminal domain-containing protein [Opitutaceae bacterium]